MSLYFMQVIDIDEEKQVFLVHYTGWNTRYDEWIPRTRISENSSLRTDQVVCPPQGRGPGQTSVSDSAASSDAGSVSRESTSTTPKTVKKKPRPSALPPSTTRSKSGITTRKRLSSEGDAISTKRKTRKRAGRLYENFCCISLNFSQVLISIANERLVSEETKVKVYLSSDDTFCQRK